MKRGILWFRNDLRLRDNEALTKAVQNCEEVIPIYVLDQRLLAKDRWGFVRTGPYRLKFLLESLDDLKKHLQEKGSDLLLQVGLPEKILPTLAEEFQATTVFASKEYADEEVRIDHALQKYLDIQLFHTSPLIHPEDCPFAADQVPEVFTQFRKRVEKYSQVRPPLEVPEQISSPDLPASPLPTFSDLGITPPVQDERAALPFKGGSLAAFERVDHYFWSSDAVASYKETRNGLIGEDYSTKFSPWLTNGSISAREIYDDLERYEQEIVSNKSTYWVKFELLWRDYFKYVTMKYGRKIFFPGGIQDKMVRWKNNPKVFRKWAYGETGDDFVDANMKELLYTGFMSNRGRQNVASYLVHRLKQDWRLGAAWFESLLIDYDVNSNYGNWMYAAGVGNDPRDRVFNTQKQADRYDPDSAYRDLWLEEAPEKIRNYVEHFFSH
jgi:deoxyribodipyrimidine photo-lyase